MDKYTKIVKYTNKALPLISILATVLAFVIDFLICKDIKLAFTVSILTLFAFSAVTYIVCFVVKKVVGRFYNKDLNADEANKNINK